MALINKILWIIFNPIGMFFTVTHKVSRFEMIRLYLNIEDSLHFCCCCCCFFVCFFCLEHYTQNIQKVTTFLALLTLKMVWDLIMVLQLISMCKILDKSKVLWLKVVSKGIKHILGSLVLVNTKSTLFSRIKWSFYIFLKL